MRFSTKSFLVLAFIIFSNHFFAQRIDLVADINPSGNSTPYYQLEFNGDLLFLACAGNDGCELFKYDIDADEVVTLSNFTPYNPFSILDDVITGGFKHVVMDGNLYFAADDGIFGEEIWKYDGSAVTRVSDINPSGSATINESFQSRTHATFTILDGEFYFTADDGTNGIQLWKSDGTNFTQVTSFSNAVFHEMVVLGDELVFSAKDDATGNELWKYDGTTVSLIEDIMYSFGSSDPSHLVEYNGKVYFSADDYTHGRELWQYDGTSASLAANINYSLYDSNPFNLMVYDGHLYFFARDNNNSKYTIYKYDGTNLESAPDFPNTNNSFDIDEDDQYILAGSGGAVFASPKITGDNNQRRLFKYDGSNLTKVSDEFFEPVAPMGIGDELFFTARSNDHGQEMWVYKDGTASMIKDLNPGTGKGVHFYSLPTRVGDNLFFAGQTPEHGIELFKISCGFDGTIDVSACTEYTSPSGTQVWTASGTYTDSYVSVEGCQFDYIINLTINQPSESTITDTGCEEYTAADGQVFTADGTYTVVIPNANGCDSTITLTLDILEETAGVDVVTACNTFTWIDGNTYHKNNNIATHTLTNSAGCDSVVTLNLTINNLDSEVAYDGTDLTVNESGATYQWIDCDTGNPIASANGQTFTPTTSGNYAVEMVGSGCTVTSSCVEFQILANPMIGTYSIGATGADYANFNEAVDDLNLRGISGEVNFMVQSGMYDESIFMENVYGASQHNLISFIGADVASVYLESSDPAGQSMVVIDGAKGISFQNITFSSEAGAAADKYAIEMINGTQHIIIDNCHFEDDSETWYSFMVGNNSQNLKLSNSTFTTGFGGFDLNNSRDIEISNNDFGNVYYPTYGYEDTSLVFSNNICMNTNLGFAIIGGEDLFLEKNKIHADFTNGIYINDVDDVRVQNNFIQAVATTNSYAGEGLKAAAFFYDCNNVEFYHNTAIAKTRALALERVRFSTFKNNIFQNTENKRLMYDHPGIGSNLPSHNFYDYNLYYRTTNTNTILFNIPQFHYDLESWQAASAGSSPVQNTNSVYMEPLFVSESDFHLADSDLFKFGDPSVGIDEDIDGHIRDLTGPVDVGADEGCVVLVTQDVQTACESFNWVDGITYTESNTTATHINESAGYCFERLELDLTIYKIDATVTFKDDGVTVAEEAATSYQWFDCDTGNPVANTMDFSPTVSGNYAVEVTKYGCTKTSECISFFLKPNPMIGCYSIDASGADYPNFSAAVADLDDRGIAGKVCFNIQAGTYDETFSIPAIYGTSRHNTISFLGDDLETVIFEASTIPNNGMITLDGVDNLIFQNITFSGNAAQGVGKSVFEMLPETNSITFDSCHFQDDAKILFNYIYGIENEKITLSNSTFASGLAGFIFDYSKILTCTNNHFGAVDFPIYLTNDTFIICQNNIIPEGEGGIYVGSSKEITLEKNQLKGMGYPALQIEFSKNITVNNNFIDRDETEIIGTDIWKNAVAFNENDRIEFHHNTVRSHSKVIDFRKTTNSNFKNNIFENLTGEYILRDKNDGSSAIELNNNFDYNLYYCHNPNGSNLFNYESTNFTDLDAWRATFPNQNKHSKFMQASFVSDDDLHLAEDGEHRFGDPSVGINTDIDGEIRNLAGLVNVGADEVCQNTLSTDFITSCDETFTWIDGNIYSENNSTATFVLENAFGCDSVITLNLTLLESSSTVDEVTACNSFTWIDGITYTSDNNSATHILTNSVGCDSVITLNLTIESVNTTLSVIGSTMTANVTDATFQWMNCDTGQPIVGENNNTFTATQNGNYAVEITQNGCTETSACFEMIITNTEDVFSKNIQVFPNPTKGDFSIDLGKIETDFSIQVFNSLGKEVKHLHFDQGQKIDLSIEEAAGVYFVEITSKDGERGIFQIIKN